METVPLSGQTDVRISTLVTLKQLFARIRVQCIVGPPMLLAITIVLSGFGLLYFAVANEERHIQRAGRSRKT